MSVLVMSESVVNQAPNFIRLIFAFILRNIKDRLIRTKVTNASVCSMMMANVNVQVLSADMRDEEINFWSRGDKS